MDTQEKKILQKSNIVLGAIALVLIAGCAFALHTFQKKKTTETPVLSDTAATKGWATYTDPDEGITFKYPADFTTTYIHPVDWPPMAQVMDGTFTCKEVGATTASAGRTTKRTINGKEYCVTEETEGAAGSMYTQYAYQAAVGGKLVFLTFTTRAPQCDNYDDPAKTACKTERNSFSIDSLIDQIFQTVGFN